MLLDRVSDFYVMSCNFFLKFLGEIERSDSVSNKQRLGKEVMEYRGGLFTSWKFGFVFDSRPHDLQLPALELLHIAFEFFMEN